MNRYESYLADRVANPPVPVDSPYLTREQCMHYYHNIHGGIPLDVYAQFMRQRDTTRYAVSFDCIRIVPAVV